MKGERTKAIHGHGISDRYGLIIPSIYTSSIFEFLDGKHAIRSDRGFVIKYTREENPTLRALEKVMIKLKETDNSLASASSMTTMSIIIISVSSMIS